MHAAPHHFQWNSIFVTKIALVLITLQAASGLDYDNISLARMVNITVSTPLITVLGLRIHTHTANLAANITPKILVLPIMEVKDFHRF